MKAGPTKLSGPVLFGSSSLAEDLTASLPESNSIKVGTCKS
jgi:hypothetical protein